MPNHSPLFPAQPSDPAEAERARAAVERLFAFELSGEQTPEPSPAARRRQGHALCDGLDPVALASQYIFAIHYYATPGLSAVPACVWRAQARMAEGPHPIERLLPKESRDFSGEGDWDLPAHERASEALAIAVKLMSQGFVWDADFQAYCDSEVSERPMMDHLLPLLEAQALEAQTLPGAASRPAPRV